MQGFKKTLVALLAVTMVLSLVGTAFAAIPEDVAGTKYEDAAVRLMALGVFKGDDKGNFNPDAQITRAEAVAIIVRALGLEQSAELMKGVTKFADVNADPGLQWATGVINIAVSAGIVDGYPNGQFGGRDPVKYEELAKMILYALNYGITVEGGVWPTAVLAKADELGVLDGINVVAGAPIIRGLAAKMLDNSLDVESLEQTGYGDLKQYEKTGKTLLEKMGFEEVEGWVVGIPEVDNALDEDEVEIDDDVYTVLEGVDVAGLFGLKVKVWVNDDDEIVFVQKKTADKDIYVDTLDGKVENYKVDLVVLDDDVTFDEDAVVYVNYKKAKLSALDEGFYGRLVKDKNKIVFASLFKFATKDGVVTKVDGQRIKYFLDSDTERTLNLTAADSVTVFNADLTKMAFEDIEEDNVMSWWRDGDDYYIVVCADKVEGTLDKLRSDKVYIDGKGYTMKKELLATYSLDEDESISEWEGKVSEIDDLDGEDVVALLNLKGHVRHLRGSTGRTTGTQYGVVTASPSDSKITVFTKDGEEVTYELAKRTDWGTLKSAPGTDTKYYGAKETLGYYIINYKLDADGMIVESDDVDIIGVEYPVEVYGTKDGEGAFDKFVANPNANLNEKAFVGQVSKGKDDEYIKLGDDADKWYVDAGTLVVRTVDSDGELDPEVLKWEDFKDLSLAKGYQNYAVVFGSKNKDAKAIFFISEGFEGSTEDHYYGVVTDKPWKSGGKWYAKIDVAGEGEDEYKLSKDWGWAKGDLVDFILNAKGEAVEDAIVQIKTADTEKVSQVDGNYVKLGTATAWTKVDKDAVVWGLDNENALDTKLVAGDIEEEDYVFVLRADGGTGVIKAVVIKAKDAPPVNGDVEYDGEIALVDFTVGAGGTVRIKIGDKTKSYEVHDDTLVLDKNGDAYTNDDVLAKGTKVQFSLIEGTDVVDVIIAVESTRLAP